MTPKFIYKNYFYKIKGGNLEISFVFKMEPENIYFRPTLVIKDIPKPKISLDNLVFHIGLIEMLSYWKASIAPKIVIEAGYLNQEQIKWWKNLIIGGMGQFFYENKIDWRKPDFLKIISLQSLQRSVLCKLLCKLTENRSLLPLKNRYLVPFAGGRDSIVTLEKLKEQGKEMACFMVNPTKTALAVHRTFRGLKKPIVVERKIDPKLLELNKKGYLNGHTPFTSLLSFISVLCAVLFDYKNIAFSNEKSASEGNVKYLGKIINHQWSKSYEFEKKFKNYCEKYLVKGLHYFSYLRKYTDLEISKMFAKYPKYFSVFSSCNAGTKIGKKWCAKCPKCLFVYLTLYPYLDKKQIIKIFGKDLFDPSTGSGQENLLPIMKSLIGKGSHKPFECVGTYQESREAALLSLEKAKKSAKVPYLLKQVRL